MSYFSLAPELWADRAGLRALGGVTEFGFEAEYDALEPLLEFYEPVGELKRAGEASAVTAARLRAFSLSLEHGDHRAILQKIGGPEFLPAQIFRDDTGNVELILPPRRALAQFWEEISWINAHLGVGSMQAMVSLPRESFFAAPARQLGYLNFFNELDTLEKLRGGHLAQAFPARSFLHPYLGPMTELRHRSLRKYFAENAAGNLLQGEEITRIARREHSFKFVGGTAYRPDIAAPHKTCLEVRDAHRNAARLRERVARILFYWRRSPGFKALDRFAAMPAFDSAAVFESLETPLQGLLRRACAIAIPPRVLGHAKPTFAYEVFRNFSYPLKNWGPWLELLGPEAAPGLARAQAAYLDRLRSLTSADELSARAAAGAALAAFAEESGLYPLFREEEARLVGGNDG